MSRDFVEMERVYLFGSTLLLLPANAGRNRACADEADYRLYLRKDIPSFVR